MEAKHAQSPSTSPIQPNVFFFFVFWSQVQPVGHCKGSNRFSVVFGLNAQPSILCLSILVFCFLTFFKRRSFALRLECLKAVTPTISVDTQENGGRSLFTNFCPYDIISLVLIDARRKKQQQPSSFIRFYSLLWIETKE